MKAVCKPRVFLQLLDCSAAQAVIFETTTRHDKGTSPTTGDASPVYTTVIWSQKMELLLIREDFWDVIKEVMPVPVDNLWSKRDAKARATIGPLVEDNQLLHMQGATTAREAWEKLKEHHQKATLSSTIFLNKRIFRLLLPEGGDVENHVSELLTLTNKLAALGEELEYKL